MTAAEITFTPARPARRPAGLRAALAAWWAGRTEARLARVAESPAHSVPAHLLAEICLSEAPAPAVQPGLRPVIPPHRAPLAPAPPMPDTRPAAPASSGPLPESAALAEAPEADRVPPGGSVLGLARGLLLRNGAPAPLRPTPFRLLACLARNAGRVMGKDELLAEVWPGVTVTEDSLTQAISEIRARLGPRDQSLLRTIPRRGYLLKAAPGGPNAATGAARPARQGLARRQRRGLPRIAVLPFEDATGASDLVARVAMLDDETAPGLAGFRTVVVLARQSAVAAVAAQGRRDPAAVARLLGVDYVLDGTAHARPEGFLLALYLNSGADNALVWSDAFDCAGDAVLTLKDRVAHEIVGHLASSFEADSQARAACLPTSSLTAFGLFAQACILANTADRARLVEAHGLLQNAISADPGFGLVHSWLARTELVIHDCGLSPPAVRAEALHLARTGADRAAHQARALAMLGFAQAHNEEYGAAETNIARALETNPCCADSMRDEAHPMICRGRPAETLAWLERDSDMRPLPDSHFHVLRFEALYQLGCYAEAEPETARVESPGPRQKVWKAAMAAKLGRSEAVYRLLDEVEAHEPGWDHLGIAERSCIYERPEIRAHMLEGLRQALAIWRGAAAWRREMAAALPATAPSPLVLRPAIPRRSARPGRSGRPRSTRTAP